MRIESFFEPIVYVTAKVTHGCNQKCNYCKVDSLSEQIHEDVDWKRPKERHAF